MDGGWLSALTTTPAMNATRITLPKSELCSDLHAKRTKRSVRALGPPPEDSWWRVARPKHLPGIAGLGTTRAGDQLSPLRAHARPNASVAGW
jgi:hypothetical protein